MERKKIKERYLEILEDVLRNNFMKSLEDATAEELYYAVSKISLNEVTKAWKKTEEKYRFCQLKQINYLTMEVLPGRLLGNNLRNCGTQELIEDIVNEVLKKRKISLDCIEDQEKEPALGNGGLGRLSACILEALTSQGYNVCGHSLRYKKGLFEQKIRDGKQIESADYWEKDGYPLGILRKELKQKVVFGRGDNEIQVEAVPFDIPIVGFPTHGFEEVKVTTLRLWDAVNEPNITESLYPSDKTDEGKLLRLKQQYLLTSASIQQIVSEYKAQYHSFQYFKEKIAIHINDTHPAIAIPELMRVLMDENGLSWKSAWDITTKCCAYTNHTILKEALETWSIDLFKNLLPRVYEIIEEIDRRFVKELRENFENDEEKVKSMAVLYDGQLRMANLAIIGSSSVNGVAKVHTGILKQHLFKDFNDWMPSKFKNITNGVTHRQFLYDANPLLSRWISTKCNSYGWITDMRKVKKFGTFANDPESQHEFLQIKYKNKEKLAAEIYKKTGIVADPEAIFDVHVKRQHEYKRQLMNVLRIHYLYNMLKSDKNYLDSFYPMVFIFAGKAHPDYKEAKLIITEICKLADTVNNDPAIQGKLKVVFLENYNVTLAKKIFLGSDVSQQISTASKEASGTGNMKFMMNGAVTMGTLDGANIEIMEAVGRENMFIFGASAEEIMELEKTKTYDAKQIYLGNEKIKYAVDQLDPELRSLLIDSKGSNVPADPYFVLLDLMDYIDSTQRLNEIYKDSVKWAHMAIMNIACSGKFSIDRTVHEYVKEVWHAESIYED